MFDRVELEVVLTLKVAVKLNWPCSMHWFVPGIPPWNTLTLLESTAAMLTSLAVQLFALLTSAKQLFTANAGVARTAIASKLQIKRLQNFVLQLIISSWESEWKGWWKRRVQAEQDKAARSGEGIDAH